MHRRDFDTNKVRRNGNKPPIRYTFAPKHYRSVSVEIYWYGCSNGVRWVIKKEKKNQISVLSGAKIILDPYNGKTQCNENVKL